MSAILMQNGKSSFADANGRPLISGTVAFYSVGTNTPKDTWQDSGQSVLNTNPIVLDARGEASIYGLGAYRQVVKDASGNLIWDQVIPDLLQVLNTSISQISDQVTFINSRFELTVTSVSALRSVISAKYKNVMVLGYYDAGDGGGGAYYFDATDTTTADNGGTIIVAADGARWKLAQRNVITTRQFGARANGTADDSVAVKAFFTYGIANHCEMVISRGIHAMASPLVINITPLAAVGIKIRGEGGIVDCGFDMTSVPAASGTPFQIIGDMNAALFYMHITGFRVTTSYDGVGVRIGRDDLTDAFNEGTFDLWINNNSKGNNAVTLEANHILHCDLRFVLNGAGSGRPNQPLSPGYGTALISRQLIMNKVFLAVGNANKGIYFTGGFTYGNVFGPVDIEEVNYGILSDAANFTKNTFVGGQWLALNMFNCTAGQANKIINPNINLYSGGVQNVSIKGLEFDQPYVYGITTPAFPASGTYVTNNTGRKIVLSIVNAASGAQMTGCDIFRTDGFTEGQPYGASWTGTMDKVWLPGEQIRFNYTGSLAWLWRPA